MTAGKDNGGPAFPADINLITGAYMPGLSVLDYFAGQALAGWMAGDRLPAPDVTANLVWDYAEAMLAERRRRTEPKP